MERLRVVVADDAAIVRKLVGEIIEGAGHAVVGEAPDGAEAVALYESLQPDVILLDVNMPELDGVAAAEAIRRSNPTANVVLASVFLNGTRPADVEFVQKPFAADVLVEAIERVAAASAA